MKPFVINILYLTPTLSFYLTCFLQPLIAFCLFYWPVICSMAHITLWKINHKIPHISDWVSSYGFKNRVLTDLCHEQATAPTSNRAEETQLETWVFFNWWHWKKITSFSFLLLLENDKLTKGEQTCSCRQWQGEQQAYFAHWGFILWIVSPERKGTSLRGNCMQIFPC